MDEGESYPLPAEALYKIGFTIGRLSARRVGIPRGLRDAQLHADRHDYRRGWLEGFSSAKLLRERVDRKRRMRNEEDGW